MANYRHPVPPAPSPDFCMIVDHLCVWGEAAPDPTGRCRVDYLGYPLCLSPDEQCILLALCRAAEDGRVGMDATALAAAVETAATAETADTAAVAVYIKRINGKAREIGGRDLIVRDRHRGWRLNGYM